VLWLYCLFTGDPKGVMISHANLVSAIAGCNQYLESFNESLGEEDSYLSFLPLAHVFDRCACMGGHRQTHRTGRTANNCRTPQSNHSTDVAIAALVCG
jgi:long-subunit acyl-CoA synthetase (AMP-forming)